MPELRLEKISSGQLAPWNITIVAGETVTLSGASGSGKSRLLRAIVELDPDSQGDAWLDQQQRSAIPAFEWRKKIAYLPAVSHWWEEQISEHFSQTNVPLEALGLTQQHFHSATSMLSTGERQRLALLRLLANQPQGLLLDEPTANLDAHHTALVETLILDYQKQHQVPILWISHDKEQQQRISQRHFEIIDGEIRQVSRT